MNEFGWNNCFPCKISCSFTWDNQKNSTMKGNALKLVFLTMGQKRDRCGVIVTLQKKNVFPLLSDPIFMKIFMVTLSWMDWSMIKENTHRAQFQVDFFIIFYNTLIFHKKSWPRIVYSIWKFSALNDLRLVWKFRSFLPGYQWIKLTYWAICFATLNSVYTQLCKTWQERDSKIVVT